MRLNVSASLGSADPEEKEYAWGDVDHDAPDFDVDLVVVRKQPLTTAGGRRNVLLLNDGGVLTDHTDQYIPGFLAFLADKGRILSQEYDGADEVRIRALLPRRYAASVNGERVTE